MTNMSDAAYSDPKFAEVETSIPHRRLEAWKWTDVRQALSAKPDGLSAALTPEFRDTSDTPTDVEIREADIHDAHPLGLLLERFGQDAYTVTIPDGVNAGTLTVTSLERGNGAIRITLGQGAKLHLVEHHDGEPDTFINADFDIEIGADAQLTRTVLQKDHDTTVRIATARIHMAGRSKLTQHIFATGAALTRFETIILGEGQGVEVLANGGYLLSGKRHADFTTLVELQATDAVIRQSVKGIATDNARGVFQGKFHVHRAAQHTDAEMRHDALMLSDRAKIRSKPELEIYADDVECAHGNTIGQLDESALFYMRQRGIPEAQARALLIDAFLAEVFEDCDMQEQISERISAWLETAL